MSCQVLTGMQMKFQVLWNDILWRLVNTDILVECTAYSFSIWLSWICNIHDDWNLQFMENRHCVKCSWNLFYWCTQ